MSSAAQSGRRPYNASGRRAQAQANRERILVCARELFVERGYAGTSMADIADAAGISTPTVFARFGSKSALLKEAVETAIVGDSEPVPLAQRPEMQHVLTAESARDVLVRLAELFTTMAPRVVPIATVMYLAADTDPEIAAMAAEQDELRLRGAGLLADAVLRHLDTDDTDTDGTAARRAEIRDIIWMINAPLTYRLMVVKRGWTPQRFAAWAARTLLATIEPLPATLDDV